MKIHSVLSFHNCAFFYDKNYCLGLKSIIEHWPGILLRMSNLLHSSQNILDHARSTFDIDIALNIMRQNIWPDFFLRSKDLLTFHNRSKEEDKPPEISKGRATTVNSVVYHNARFGDGGGLSPANEKQLVQSLLSAAELGSVLYLYSVVDPDKKLFEKSLWFFGWSKVEVFGAGRRQMK